MLIESFTALDPKPTFTVAGESPRGDSHLSQRPARLKSLLIVVTTGRDNILVIASVSAHSLAAEPIR